MLQGCGSGGETDDIETPAASPTPAPPTPAPPTPTKYFQAVPMKPCPSGSVIASRSECIQAATDVNHTETEPDRRFENISHPHIPSGCIADGPALIFWTGNTTDFDGLAPHGDDYSALCMASADSPYFNTASKTPCPSGNAITSKNQCEDAAVALRHSQTSITSEDNSLPGGCVARAGELVWSNGNNESDQDDDYFALCSLS